jgi:DNA uptake protein ComE-like DNA-binding protein
VKAASEEELQKIVGKSLAAKIVTYRIEQEKGEK